jgi:hypothetical protein
LAPGGTGAHISRKYAAPRRRPVRRNAIFLEVVLLIVGVVLPWGSDDRGVEICPLIAGNPAVASAASKRSKRTSQGEYGPIFN